MMLKRFLKTKETVNRLQGQLEALRTQKKELFVQIQKKKKEAKDANHALIILKEYLSTIGEDVIESIETTVTSALREIFDDSYTFKIGIESHKNRKSCEFYIKHSQCEEFVDLSYTQGTCLKSVVSVVLRIILVSLDKRLHKTIILDEPFSGAEDERIPKIAEFISTMSKRLNIQIVMVTQSELFESGADKVIMI